MTFIDFIVVLLFAGIVLVGLKSGLINALKSFASLILSYIFSFLTIKPLMSILSGFGLRENLYSPIIVFIFLLIVFWGIIFTVLSGFYKEKEKKIPKWLGVFPAILTAFVLTNIIYVLLFGFVGEKTIMAKSKICPLFVEKNFFNIYSNKPFIYKEEAVDGKLILTEQETEVIMIPNLPDYAVSSAESEKEMLQVINSFRVENGLDPLRDDNDLKALSNNYATEILKTKRFSHMDKNSKMPEDRAITFGVRFNYIGENLAIAPTLESAHNGLIKSSSHRDNLLQPLFRRAGISVRQLNNSSVLIVQEFSN